MENLYDYLFHYNHIQELWFVFKREDKEKYFNGDLKDCLKSKNILNLIEILTTKK